ncbi:MAG: hypothetical protein OXT67_01025 [Zetaproteobacteria bacterium]|nr:hypothetical protein [Zetaproteobacteria bacterium]
MNVFFSLIFPVLVFGCKSFDRQDQAIVPAQNSKPSSFALAQGQQGWEEITQAAKGGKVIFTYWDKGEQHLLENRPFEKAVMRNWKEIHENKGYKIFVLDSQKGSKYNINDIFAYGNQLHQNTAGKAGTDINMFTLEDVSNKGLGTVGKEAQAFSDIARIGLLEAFGGTWLDNSVMLSNSVDNIFMEQIQNSPTKTMGGFFHSHHGRLENGYLDSLESWFISAKKDSPAIREYRKNVWEFLQKIPNGSSPADLDVLQHPSFKVQPEMTVAQRAVREKLKYAVEIMDPKYRNYLWFYLVWKKTIIENPQLKKELVARSAGVEDYGPMGQEHIFDHLSNKQKAGFESFRGKHKAKLLKRYLSYEDPRYRAMGALKYSSDWSAGFRNAKDAAGHKIYQTAEDYHRPGEMIRQMTEVGKQRAQLGPVIVEEGEFLRRILGFQDKLIRGKLSDFPGSKQIQLGLALVYARRQLNHKVKSLEEHLQKGSQASRQEIGRLKQELLTALGNEKQALEKARPLVAEANVEEKKVYDQYRSGLDDLEQAMQVSQKNWSNYAEALNSEIVRLNNVIDSKKKLDSSIFYGQRKVGRAKNVAKFTAAGILGGTLTYFWHTPASNASN